MVVAPVSKLTHTWIYNTVFEKLDSHQCFLFYETAAVALLTNPAADGVDHQSQQVRYEEKRCSQEVISMFVIASLVTFLCMFSQTSDDALVYSAPTFRKSGRADRKEANAEEKEECIYTNVKALELD